MPPKKTKKSSRTLPSRQSMQQNLAPAAHKTGIVDMTPELLRSIFIVYYNSTHAPILLLLVCKQWSQIVRGIPIFWNDIRFHPWRKDLEIPEIHTTMHMPITCLGWKKLKSAATRVEGWTLRISCEFGEWGYDANQSGSNLKPNPEAGTWLTPKCCHLEIDYVYELPAWFVETFKILPNLVKVSLRNTGFASTDVQVHRFLYNIEVSSLKLNSLVVTSFPTNRQQLLQRLQKLDCRQVLDKAAEADPEEDFEEDFEADPKEDPYDILREACKLEELHIRGGIVGSGLSHVSEKLLSLNVIQCRALSTFSFAMLESLVLLHAVTGYNTDFAVYHVIKLPVLKRLRCEGSWEHLSLIEAPALDFLDFWLFREWEIITSPMNPSSTRRSPSSTPINLQPRVLTVMGIPDIILMDLLRNIWSGIQKLTWKHREEYPSLDEQLVSALAGTASTPLCSQLQDFDMKTRNRIHFPIRDGTHPEVQIRSIMSGRQTRGLPLWNVFWRWDPRDDSNKLKNDGYWIPDEECIRFI